MQVQCPNYIYSVLRRYLSRLRKASGACLSEGFVQHPEVTDKMNKQTKAEVNCIIDLLGKLYLNEDFSDVLFMIGGEKLPAHQNILGLRCPVFKSMFLEERAGPKMHTIVMSEQPIGAFKQLLKFIYTGTITFPSCNEVDGTLDILELARKYEMLELQDLCVDRVKSDCSITNVCAIINRAVEWSDESLITHCLDYLYNRFLSFVEFGSFEKLTVEALQCIIEKEIQYGFFDIVFEALVSWLKANPSEKERFPEVLKPIHPTWLKLTQIQTLNLIDGVNIELPKEKPIYPEGNVLASCYNAKVIRGGPSTFFTDPIKGATLKHGFDNDNDKSIVIDLERPYMLNHIEMELAYGNRYRIEVSDGDSEFYSTVINYSKYTCYSVQKLYFNETAVRYIRIRAVAPYAGYKGVFELVYVKAFHTKEPLQIDQRTNIVIPSDNVAQIGNNATLIQGAIGAPLSKFASNQYYLCHEISDDNCIVIQLPQPYLLSSMSLKFGYGGINSRIFGCNLEVSSDGSKWRRVCEQTGIMEGYFKFRQQVVVYVKITGTSAFGEAIFACNSVELPGKK